MPDSTRSELPNVVVVHQDPASAAAIALVLRTLPLHVRVSTEARRVVLSAGRVDLVVLAYAHTTPALELARALRPARSAGRPRLLWIAGTSVRRVDLRCVDAVLWRPFRSEELIVRTSQLLDIPMRSTPALATKGASS